ncbi:MAG: DUF167 domain-containing protein [Candidatus Omnitrophica bacterium]|nr:DUF167 domain-containing protein [Candidatus Omnitrophota bacterium]
MKIFVTARPNAKENKVEKLDETHYRVRVKAAPEEGEANAVILETLADYFGCPKSSVTLLSGQKSKNKIVGIQK